MILRGKPGTGKSTLMKWLIEHAEKSKAENHIIVSFFFHARGEELQKSTLGMYRSLLSQIFKKAPQLLKSLDMLIQQPINVTWTLAKLEKMFSDVIEKLGSVCLLCYIDALDECPEEQIRDLLRTWQELGDLSLDKGIRFRVCLSSRHYPTISIRAGIQFSLEDQEGHSNDIRKYTASELKPIGRGKQAEYIKHKVYTKSGSIFLWVVLVVQILKTEFDRGSIHKLDKRLDEIPMELNELFLDILVRDNKSLPELILCIQWILFAKRAIRREELYFALLAGDMSELSALADWDLEELNSKVMDRHILTCSKGLAETTRSKNPSVQFIHESVREFLLQPGTLSQLWSGFDNLAPGPSHQRLRQCCRLYLDFLDHKEFEGLIDDGDSSLTLKEKIHNSFPFLEYAVEQLLAHAEEAEKLNFSEAVFITCFDITKWIKLWNLVQRFQVRRFPPNTNLPYVLAKLKLPHLLARSIQVAVESMKDQPAGVEALIGQAVDDRNLDAFKVISSINHGYVDTDESRETRPFTEMFEYLQILKPGKLVEVVDAKAFSAAIKLLRNWENRVDMNIINNVFLDAASCRHAKTVRFLLENGADMAAVDDNENTALHLVASHRHLPKRKTKAQNDQQTGSSVEAMISMLLEKGIAMNSRNRDGNTALHVALYNSSAASAMLLLNKGAEFDIVNNEGLTEFHIAIRRKKYSVAKHLLESGAKVTPNPKSNGSTMLDDTAGISDEDLLEMLLADSNAHALVDRIRFTLFHPTNNMDWRGGW